MASRYFVAEPILHDQVTLTGPEAHHVLHVMRARVGERVVLFDGSGDEFEAEITQLRRSGLLLSVLARQTVDRELPCPVVLGVALPKGERQRWLVEKAVELGVTRLVPLETARSIAQPGGKVAERLARGVIEASKQSGRNRLMEVSPATSWEAFLHARHEAQVRLVAHPSAETAVHEVAPPVPAGPVALAVGPEGGFTEAEVHTAIQAGWLPVGLGPRILRVETAALALVAAVTAQWARGLPRPSSGP